jgi:PKD repeat protein
MYKRYIGGVLSTMNDTPKYNFYFNGGISNRGAPATYAPLLAVSTPGYVAVPVTTTGFTTIEAFALYLEYDPAVLTYQNTFTKNAAFGSAFQVGSIAGTGGKMLIVIQWYGSQVTLADGSAICTLDFTYSAGSGTFSALTWFDNGPSCEFSDALSPLIDLPAANYYHNGVVAPPLVAQFAASNLSPPRNIPVTLTDQSSGTPTAWTWTFDRPGVAFVNGTTASSQHPQVMFTEGGPYSVTLAVSNSYFADSEIKPGYIRAGVPGIWTGETSADWSVLSNWDNYLIPDGSTAVVIPSSAVNWPVFTGDLTIGIHCLKLTLSGTTSQMTVTGNLITP